MTLWSSEAQPEISVDRGFKSLRPHTNLQFSLRSSIERPVFGAFRNVEEILFFWGKVDMITRTCHRDVPSVGFTGHGSADTRSRFDGDDETVCGHQLCAIARGPAPYDVFLETTAVHHRPREGWRDLD